MIYRIFPVPTLKWVLLNDPLQLPKISYKLPETYVEFLRKRHHFAQSQGSALVPVHRSDTDGILILRYETTNISQRAAKRSISAQRERRSSSSDEDEMQQAYASEDIDWGEGMVL